MPILGADDPRERRLPEHRAPRSSASRRRRNGIGDRIAAGERRSALAARVRRPRGHQRLPRPTWPREAPPEHAAHRCGPRALVADGGGRLFRPRVRRRLAVLEARAKLLSLVALALLVGRREPALVVAVDRPTTRAHTLARKPRAPQEPHEPTLARDRRLPRARSIGPGHVQRPGRHDRDARLRRPPLAPAALPPSPRPTCAGAAHPGRDPRRCAEGAPPAQE